MAKIALFDRKSEDKWAKSGLISQNRGKNFLFGRIYENILVALLEEDNVLNTRKSRKKILKVENT